MSVNAGFLFAQWRVSLQSCQALCTSDSLLLYPGKFYSATQVCYIFPVSLSLLQLFPLPFSAVSMWKGNPPPLPLMTLHSGMDDLV